MFAAKANYPCAVTGGDNDGLRAGLQWCAEKMQDDDVLTLFVPLKAHLAESDLLQEWSRYRDVDIVVSRGGGHIRAIGPVLAAWPDMDDLGKITRSAARVRALCVAAWVEDWIRPWAAATRAEVIGEASDWSNGPALSLDPVVEEAMKGLTLTINHNNTISAGYEKDSVVGVLLMLHGAGYRLDGETLQGWALAHGWAGKNPQKLAKYADDISRGSRPRTRSMPRADYLETLRRRTAGNVRLDPSMKDEGS